MKKKKEIDCPCGEYNYTVRYVAEDKTALPNYCAFCGVEIDDEPEEDEDNEDE